MQAVSNKRKPTQEEENEARERKEARKKERARENELKKFLRARAPPSNIPRCGDAKLEPCDPVVLAEGDLPNYDQYFEHKCNVEGCFWGRFSRHFYTSKTHCDESRFEQLYSILYCGYVVDIDEEPPLLAIDWEDNKELWVEDLKRPEAVDPDDCQIAPYYKDEIDADEQGPDNWNGYRPYHFMIQGDLKEIWLRSSNERNKSHWVSPYKDDKAAMKVFPSYADLVMALAPRFAFLDKHPFYELLEQVTLCDPHVGKDNTVLLARDEFSFAGDQDPKLGKVY